MREKYIEDVWRQSLEMRAELPAQGHGAAVKVSILRHLGGDDVKVRDECVRENE